MLVNTFGKKISASTVAKNSQFYIEVAKFVQAYNVVVNSPNEFLKEIGENEINLSNEKLSWESLSQILQKCDFGFAETPTNSDLLVYFNYAIEIGSISKNDKKMATVDDVADAQKNYYNFVDNATENAEKEFEKQHRITNIREKEVAEIDKKLNSFSTQKWIAFSLSILSVILFCLGVAGLFFSNPLVEIFGMIFPIAEKRYIGSVILITLSIVMFYFCEKWQANSKQEYQKLNYASQTIFSRSNHNFVTERIMRRKLEALKRDLETIKSELNDENKTFDVKANIEKLIMSNEYYKRFLKQIDASLEAGDKAQQISIEENAMQQQESSYQEELSENAQEIVLEGQFDEEAYFEKFENTKKDKKTKQSNQKEIINNEQASDLEEDAKIQQPINEEIERQAIEAQSLESEKKNKANKKSELEEELTEEKIDNYISYIKEILGESISEEDIQFEK